MITEAELSAMYGRGLHPDTAARVIEELRALRARLAAVETERDSLRSALFGAHQELDKVEAERDHWHKIRDAYFESSRQEQARAEAAEARLAAVLDLIDDHEAEDMILAYVEEALGLRAAGIGPYERARTRALIAAWKQRTEAAESHLAAVLALCDAVDEFGTSLLSTSEVRAAAQGEDDRPATRGHQHEEWMLDDSAKGGKYCRACGEHIGEGDRG